MLDKAVSYSVMYERLKYYLTSLGLFEDETPHSFRAGCTITMALSGSADNAEQAMKHIGWFSKSSAECYGRMHTLVDSAVVASNLSKSVYNAGDYETIFKEQADYSGLKKAFD